MKSFKTNNKATVTVTFPVVPDTFKLFDSNGLLYYFRDLSPKQKTISFNVAKADQFKTNVSFTDIKIEPLKIFDIDEQLPPIEKYYPRKKFKYVYNPLLTGTPARHFFKKGIIEYGKDFLKQPFPIRVFILCHEVGHCFYSDEHSADLFATKLFLSKGYNKTSAYYALKNVLNLSSSHNMERVEKLFQILND